MSMTLKLAGAALLVVLLAGCTPTAVPPTIETPTPTPSESAPASGQPLPTLPLTCADLFTASTASAAVGQQVQPQDATTLLNDSSSIAARQAGMLDCAWDPAGDWRWKHVLSLSVLGDADEEFAARVGGEDQDGCYFVDEAQSYCLSNVLIDGYWVALSSVSVGSSEGRTQEAADAAWATAVSSLSAAVSSADAPRAAWVPPTGTFTGAVCNDLEPAQVWPITSVQEAAARRVALPTCATGDGWTIQVIPGGAWALPDMAATLPQSAYEIGAWQGFAVPGADTALWACGDGCHALASIGGSTVYIQGPVDVPEEFVAAAQAEFATVVAAG